LTVFDFFLANLNEGEEEDEHEAIAHRYSSEAELPEHLDIRPILMNSEKTATVDE
jgi:hypothetical protein